MTVYVTSDELLEIEHARLTLRRSTGKAVDRGRLVRAAIAMALAEFEEGGEESDLAARLRDSCERPLSCRRRPTRARPDRRRYPYASRHYRGTSTLSTGKTTWRARVCA